MKNVIGLNDVFLQSNGIDPEGAEEDFLIKWDKFFECSGSQDELKVWSLVRSTSLVRNLFRCEVTSQVEIVFSETFSTKVLKDKEIALVSQGLSQSTLDLSLFKKGEWFINEMNDDQVVCKIVQKGRRRSISLNGIIFDGGIFTKLMQELWIRPPVGIEPKYLTCCREWSLEICKKPVFQGFANSCNGLED